MTKKSQPAVPPRRSATTYDVAKLAGVSQSAVSRAFTEGASIAEPTRLKIVEAARELGYRPNLIAKSLITRQSNLVGVAMGDLQNPFYADLLERLSEALAEMNYRALLFITRRGEGSDPILEEVLRFRPAALVLVSAALSSHFDEECQQAGVPVVLLNRTTESTTVSSVTGDNRVGAAAIADFLLAGGHRRLAFLAGLEDSSTSRDRENGFTDRLAERGHPTPARFVGHYDFTATCLAARTMLSSPDSPDAVFCANDMMALAVMNVARSEFGLEIGRELSIVGFDDIAPASWPQNDLTTYIQPVADMARRTVQIIRQQITDRPGVAVKEKAPGRLVVRGSARKPIPS
jgi:DNA-binding LacI/PurR family transcriptional regulator